MQIAEAFLAIGAESSIVYVTVSSLQEEDRHCPYLEYHAIPYHIKRTWEQTKHILARRLILPRILSRQYSAHIARLTPILSWREGGGVEN